MTLWHVFPNAHWACKGEKTSPVGADKLLYRDPSYRWTVTTRATHPRPIPKQTAPACLREQSASVPGWSSCLCGGVSIGSKASAADRRAITEIVRSVHFRHESHTLTFGPYSASETIRMRVPRYYKGRQTKFDAGTAGEWASRVSSNPVVAAARRIKVPGSYAVVWDAYHPFKLRILGYARTPRGADTITTELTTAFTAYMHRLMLRTQQPGERWQFVTEPLVSATKISHLQPGAIPQPFKIRR